MTTPLLGTAAPQSAQSAAATARSLSRLASSGKRPLVIDPALAEAASRHAREVLADENKANRDRVDDALKVEGLADAQLLPFTTIGTDVGALTQEASRFAEETVRARGMTHLGAALVKDQGRTALSVIYARRLIELTPLPRAPKSASFIVRGRARTGDQIEALLLGPCDSGFERCSGGEVRALQHSLNKKGALTVPIALKGSGRYAFELLVARERGPEIAALWTFDFGRVPDPAAEPRLEDLGALVDRARNSRELAPLELDPALRSAAGGHATEVCNTMIASHVTSNGDPSARAGKAGYRGRVTENVAIAGSISRAHANLMKSPSHRRNVLDPLAASAGLAVVKKDQVYCVVELFGLGEAPGQTKTSTARQPGR